MSEIAALISSRRAGGCSSARMRPPIVLSRHTGRTCRRAVMHPARGGDPPPMLVYVGIVHSNSLTTLNSADSTICSQRSARPRQALIKGEVGGKTDGAQVVL